MIFSIFALTGAMLAATAAASPIGSVDTHSLAANGKLITRAEAELIAREVAANHADPDLPVGSYVIIAPSKLTEARSLAADGTLIATRDLEKESAGASGAGPEIIAIAVVQSVGGGDPSAKSKNAYSDYVEAADPKDVLGE